MRFTLNDRRNGAPRLARRALSICAIALMTNVGAACSDSNPFLSPPTSENTVRAFSVWALSGTNSALPASVLFSTLSVQRPQLLSNGTVNFEVAFDITADGKVRFLPARALVPQAPAGAPSIGLARSTSAFDAITRAPDRGYTDDSTLVVAVNEVVLIRLTSSQCILQDPFYGKVAVDSVILAERRIVLRALVNRNCGYRALTVGLPST
jgi:hypothetical protein